MRKVGIPSLNRTLLADARGTMTATPIGARREVVHDLNRWLGLSRQPHLMKLDRGFLRPFQHRNFRVDVYVPRYRSGAGQKVPTPRR